MRVVPPGPRAGTLERQGGPAQLWLGLLRWAVLAPSRHNAQPWRFELEGDALRLYADGRRALPAADADGRELLLGCGAALANLRLAAAHFGVAVAVEAVPEYHRHGLLARARLAARGAPAPTPDDEALFQAIPRRVAAAGGGARAPRRRRAGGGGRPAAMGRRALP